MSVNGERVRELITEQAAHWFIANRAGLTARERHDFSLWLKTSPVHVEEYLAISAIAQDLPGACAGAGEPDALIARARREEAFHAAPSRPPLSKLATGLTRPRWHPAAITLVALGGLAVSLLGWWSLGLLRHATPARIAVVHFETGHGEQQIRRLADDSVLHLNTDSAVVVRYSGSERRVTVQSGEVYFEVAHEPQRPFRVRAGPAEIVALGTRFAVRLAPEATLVTVARGRVAVWSATSSSTGGGENARPDEPLRLEAGQQVRVAAGEWPAPIVSVDVERVTAWLHRQIAFDHEPLGRVASEFNRYAAKPIEITTPSLRNLEISGVFATDDTEAFIAFLRSLDGVRVEVTPTRIRVSHE